MTDFAEYNDKRTEFGVYKCDNCGKIFITELALQGHKSGGHCA